MKIGITCYPTYGGSGVVATELGIELAAIGHQVHFITYSQPFRLTGREQGIFYHEVPVSNYPLFEYPPYDLALASRTAEVAEYYDLDLLHVHYAIPHSVSALLARQMLAARGRHLPFVTTLHGTDITLVGLDRSYLPITRFAIEQSDGVTSISHYLRERTVKEFKIKREIEVITNFVNCDFYMPLAPEVREEKRKRYAAPDEKILIHLSNFRPVKRVQDAVDVSRRWPRPFRRRMDRPQEGHPGPRPLSRQAEERQRAFASRRSDADAERARILRPCGPRSHGLPRSNHRYKRWRCTRAHRRRRRRPPLPCRRCGSNGGSRSRIAPQSGKARIHGHRSAQNSAAALLCIEDHSCVRKILRARARACRQRRRTRFAIVIIRSRHLHHDVRATSRTARHVEARRIAKEHLQPFAHIAHADTRPLMQHTTRMRPPRRNAHSIVFNLNQQLRAIQSAANGDCAAADARLQPVLDAVLDQRLQDHARHRQVKRCRIDLLHHLQLVRAKAYNFNSEIIVSKIQLIAQQHIRVMILEQSPQDIRQLHNQLTRLLRTETHERRNRIQRIE